jgi:hypothetical protein
MNRFLKGRRFREAWMVSLVAGVLFPFIAALLNSNAELNYLERVNDGFLQKTLSFSAVFFVIQCTWAVILYVRDQKSAQDPLA